MSQKIALVWWGTGGHIVPILSLVAHLITPLRQGVVENKQMGEISRDDFFWIGGQESMEQKKAYEASIRFISITTHKLTSTKSLGVFLYPFKLMQGIFEARKILTKEQPMLVFSKWWPGSVAVGIAAWTLKIPLYIHESDTVPGFSNKILGYFASRIFLGFEEAKKWFKKEKTSVVGQILHPRFFEKNPLGTIQWKTNKKHVFVSCGSQGSRKIFQALIEQKNNFSNIEWIISLWTLNQDMRAAFQWFEDTQIFDWIDQSDIPHILDDADIAITRASATTLAELSTRPIGLMIVPLAISAGNHQTINAWIYRQWGHSVLSEENLSHTNIQHIIESLSDIKRQESPARLTPLLEIFQ